MTRRRYMRVVFALWGAAIVLAVVGWALSDAMLMIARIKGNRGIVDNAGYTKDGRMLVLSEVEARAEAALAPQAEAGEPG